MSSAPPDRPTVRPVTSTGLAVALGLTLLLAGAGLVLANLSAGEPHGWPSLAGRSADRAATGPGVATADAGRPGTGAAIDQADPPVTQTVRYQYDDAGRLAAVDYGGGARLVYTYDAGGNLLAREVTGAAPPSATPTTGGTVATPTTGPPPSGPRIYLPDLARND